jgi:ferredoxin-NADP reductase
MRVPAKIVSITQETPTVKSFEFDLGDNSLEFKAGQWVDFFVRIDGAEAVGGYSITSSPIRQDRISLAIKLGGDNPVPHFLHSRARVGDGVEMQVGGDFYYTSDMAGSIVLLAGGIGVTPLMSMMRYVDEGVPGVDASLVHSAGSPSELLFRDELQEMTARNSRLRYAATVTGPSDEPWNGAAGRIDREMLERTGVDLRAMFFLSGPPSMIPDMRRILSDMGVPEDLIRYEQWW